MKFSQLRNLLAVADAGSVRQAARNLHVSQSAVTKSIRQLEEELGVVLFDRSAVGVTLTAAGEAVLARARVVEAELRQARNDVETLRDGSAGIIHVSGSPSVSRSLLPRAVLNFRQRSPKTRFRVEEGVYPDVLSAIRSGDLDFAVCLVSERLVDDALTVELMIRGRLTPAVRRGHPLTRAGKTSLADLIGRDWVVYRRTQTGRDVFEQTFVSNGLSPPEATIECTSFGAILALVENSDMITLVPRQLFMDPSAPPAVVPLELEDPMPAWNVAVIYRAMHNLSALCSDFLDELRRTAGNLSGG